MSRLLWVLALAACGGWYQGAHINVRVEPENNTVNYLTVQCENGQRLGQIRALMRGQEQVRRMKLPASCSAVDVFVTFLGGVTQRLPTTLVQPEDTVVVVIPPYIGRGFGVDTVMSVVDPVPQAPIGLHVGIWRDVEACLGQRRDVTNIQWYTARLIIGEGGVLAYGMTAFSDGVPYAIVIQREYFLHPTVISHEAIHAITAGTTNDAPAIQRCTMPVPPGPLVPRVFPPDSVAKYRAR